MKNIYTNLSTAYDHSQNVGDFFNNKKPFIMKNNSLLAKAFILAMLMFFTFSLAQAATYYTRQGGQWNSNSTWSTASCGGTAASSYPGSGGSTTDIVYICDNHDVTINVDVTIASLTVGGGTSGTLRFYNQNTRILTVSGNVTIAAGGSFWSSASNNLSQTLNIGGNFTNNGTFDGYATGGSRTLRTNVVMNGTGTQTISGTPTLFEFSSLTISNTTAIVNTTTNFSIATGGTMSVPNNAKFYCGTSVISGAGAFTLAAGGTLGIGSTVGITTSGATGNIQVTGTRTFNVGANYVYNGTAAQNTGTGYPTALTGSLTIDNSSGVTIVDAARTITTGTLNLVNGTFTIIPGATQRLSMGSTATINRSGGSINGTGALQGTGIYNVNYTGNSKTTGPELSGSGLNNVTVNLTSGQTLTLDQNRAPDGNLAITTGTFDLSTFTINRSAAGGTLTVASDATLKIGGTNTLPSNYSTHSIGCTSTIEYAGTSQTIANLNSTQIYGNLVLSGSVSSSPKTLQTGTTNICNDLILSGNATTTTVVGLTIGRNLTIGDGTTFTAAGFTLTVNGLTTIGNGTSGSLIFSSASNPSKTFVGLVTVNKNASWTESAAITPEFRGGITAMPTFTGNTGVHTFTTNNQALTGTFTIPNVTVTGVTLTNSNSLTVNTALSGSGGLTQAANSNLNIGGTSGITTLTAAANSNTVNYNAASGGQTVKGTIYNTLTMGNTSGTQIAGGNITANTLNNTNAASTLDMAAYSLSLTSVNNTGTIKTQNTSSTPISSGITWGGTVEYNAAGAQTVVNGTYTNLTLSGSGAKTLPASAMSVTGNLALNGTATATTQANLSVGGTMNIANGAVLTISPANHLTVTGLTKLLGNECLVMESSSTETAPASFLDGGYDGSSTGTAKVNRYFDNSGTAAGISWDWHLLSSPVAAQTIWTAFIPAPSSWHAMPATDPWDFYYYNPNTSYSPGHTPWVNIKNANGTYNSGDFDKEGDDAGFGTDPYPPQMNVARGYLVAFDDAGLKSFSGALNTGDKDVTVKNTADLYNLVGNPYPSSIDWTSSSLVRGNLEDVGSSVYAYWIYNEDYGNYGTCLSNVPSGTNGTTKYIAPGQGFFVKAKDLTTSLGSPRVLLGLKQSARAHSSQNWLKDASIADNYISLKLTTAANTFADEIIVAFDENCLGNSGAEKFASWYTYTPEIYTVKEGKSYSIDLYQGVTSDLTVNVSVKCGVSSTYTLTATDISDFTLSNIVYLEDLKTGNKVNLKEVGSYSFTGGPNDDKARFRITFAEITGTNEPETLKPVYIYSYGKDVYVNANSLTIGNCNVYIYDALGRMVYSGSYVPAAGNQKFTSLPAPGAYVVKVISRTGTVTAKIIIP